MKLIYITGIDGCGKTTQSKMLSAYLNENEFKTQYQWLRWSPSVGNLISWFKKNTTSKIKDNNELSVIDVEVQSGENESFNKWSELKNRLFSLWIFRFLWLKYATWDYYFSYKKAASDWTGDILVLDRYYFDFIVDQSINYNESVEAFEARVNNGILKNLKKPDVFILINITPEVGWERKRDGTSMKHLQKLEKTYNSLRTNDDVYVIDGSQSPQLVHDEIKAIVSKRSLNQEANSNGI